MADYDERFTPESLDEQIRRLSSAARHISQDGADPDRRFIHDLRRVCRDDEAQEDERSLQLSWERIARVQQSERTIERTMNNRKVIAMNTFTKKAEEASSQHTFGQRFSMYIAAAVALLLVGSMAFVFSMMRIHETARTQTGNTQTGSYGSSSNTQGARAKQGTTLEVFQQSGFGIYSVDWSSNGHRIVSTGHTVASWDALTGKNSISYTTMPVPLPFSKSTSADSIFAGAVWSPDGKSFALPYYSDIQIWAGTTDKLIKTLHYTLPISHTSNIPYVHWSADGKSISAIVPSNNSLNNTIDTLVTFDLATGAKHGVQLPLSSLTLATWSPDGNYLAAASLESPLVSIVNTHTSQIAYTYHGPATVTGVSWSPNSKRIAVGFGDGKDITQVWDALTGENVVTHQGGTLPAWSPNGKYIASGRTDPTGATMNDEIQLWDPATGKTLYIYRGHQGHVYAIAWSPDSKYIASGEGSDNGTLSDTHVWVAVA